MDSRISNALRMAQSARAIFAARGLAEQHLPSFPHNGCAAFLSSFLQLAGLKDLPVITGAEDLQQTLVRRGWKRVLPSQYQAGDVAVCADQDHNDRTDHIWLVVEKRTANRAICLDNQSTMPHIREIHGGPHTPVAFFLRAPEPPERK